MKQIAQEQNAEIDIETETETEPESDLGVRIFDEAKFEKFNAISCFPG